ncbi:MAG: TatD family hydrolase [Treponema sp.]|nr:TatD family hydrolase [Treponema sp.]
MCELINFFDVHTHLDFYKDVEISSVCEIIRNNKIKTFSASVNIESFERNLKLQKIIGKDLVSVTFGVHPSYIKNLPEKEAEAFDLLNPYYEKSEIISEVGLDFFWEKDCPKDIQIMHLLIALDNANRNHKVVVLHTKGAESEIYEILKDFPDCKPVIHWYDGPVEIYKKFLEKNYPQTFGCELKYSDSIKSLLKLTPLELILPETDNPTGEPWLGGKNNSPSLIKRIYENISEVLQKDLDEMKVLLNENCKRLLLQ